MAAELLPTAYFNETQFRSGRNLPKTRASSNFSLRASQEPLGDDKSKFYKQLGMFSLRKRIEDSVLRAEMLAPTALEFEEGKHVDQEGVVRDYDLWDDLNKSNEVLAKLADSAKVVDTLRDLTFKAEEAKLITELAEMDAINYELFKQAYASSLDVNKFLDKYEMSKLLKEPYDMEGACIIIESRCGDTLSERWALQLAQMYMKWAERQGYAGRIVERYRSCNGELKYASIELEFKFAYGYLSGERGVHSLIRCSDSTSALPKASLASVDVIPLFINSSADLSIEDEDIQVSYPSYCEGNPQMSRASSAVHIHHIPTGVEVQSTGERSLFANKIKALNRLKAKLLVLLRDHGVSGVGSIKRGAATDRWSQETRKYVLHPTKMVHDLRSGAQFPDVSPVLNGNLDPLIAAHISSRQSSTAV
ncbi:peptide chain release factor PrfB3, chloroplastic isoform X3 [Salvia hispanica]|uniref:peptide chain release factor PrfB3, chloroplastic isoform X3 n=1 Tax=Salvia hispanica TaxID=49212 RepID=UPI0020090457|nr:peptide chain release factor PrfB3, chloroplastic isoform X3 [Salvia hispanica]